MSKLSPAQALPLLEQVSKEGQDLVKSGQFSHTSSWIKRVSLILADVEGASETALRELADEANYGEHHYMMSMEGDRAPASIDIWRKNALIRSVSIVSTQVHILRAKAGYALGSNVPDPAAKKVFVGHGHNSAWMELDKFLTKDLHLEVVEFNSIPTAGMTVIDRLKTMLNSVGFALLLMTAEDHVGTRKDGVRARQNVIHEIGLFQGRLGFDKAIILLEDGCERFSNIDGLIYIPFPKSNIRAAFHDIQKTLMAAGLVKPIVP